MNAPNEMLLNAVKCLGYSFYIFWGRGVKGKITHKHPPTQIMV